MPPTAKLHTVWYENPKSEEWDDALPYEDIPGPKAVPIFGNMWRFFPMGEYYNINLLEFHKKLQEKYGNIVLLDGIVGRKPLVFLFNPDDMQIMLRKEARCPVRFGMESYIHYRTLMGKDMSNDSGILALQGEDWFKFRSTVNPIINHFNSLYNYIDNIDKVAEDLVENMKYFASENINNEMPEDFLNELYKWALESVGVISLDRRLGCLNLNLEQDSDVQKLITSVTEMFNLMFVLDILPPFWKLFRTPSWKRYVEILDFITNTVRKYIDEAMYDGPEEEMYEEHLSVLQRLLKKDKKIALAMVMDMLIAGIDTTGRTLGAALYFLARNPDTQRRLREEVLLNVPNRDNPVTKEVLSRSPYLKAVIRETTRIAPVAVGTLRTTTGDMVINGYRIPKETEVLCLHLYSANSNQFLDPEKFIPERWLRSTANEFSHKNAHPFAAMPFGFGLRSCVGKRIASLELEVTLIKIIRNFELSWHHEDMIFSGKFLYGVESPLRLKVTPLDY